MKTNTKTQIPGYENLGFFKTQVIDYNHPDSKKSVTLNVFLEKRTKDIFVGVKEPQLRLENFIKGSGKEPKITCYDLSQRV